MDEHLAGKLFSNVEQPNPPWAFRRFSMSLVDERKDDEETQQTLDYLYGALGRAEARVMVCTHESSWTEETTGMFVDVGEVVGETILGG